MNFPVDHMLDAMGIRLVRLQQKDIELVRQWRNSEAVRSHMAYRDEITAEMQRAWFARLNPDCQYFYIIETQGRRVGLVNIKDIADHTGEGGIFIADESMQNSFIPLQALLAMYDFGFGALGLRAITAHILADNQRAIRLNQSLGFRKDPGQEDMHNQRWQLAHEDYVRKTQGLRTYLHATSPTEQIKNG